MKAARQPRTRRIGQISLPITQTRSTGVEVWIATAKNFCSRKSMNCWTRPPPRTADISRFRSTYSCRHVPTLQTENNQVMMECPRRCSKLLDQTSWLKFTLLLRGESIAKQTQLNQFPVGNICFSEESPKKKIQKCASSGGNSACPRQSRSGTRRASENSSRCTPKIIAARCLDSDKENKPWRCQSSHVSHFKKQNNFLSLYSRHRWTLRSALMKFSFRRWLNHILTAARRCASSSLLYERCSESALPRLWREARQAVQHCWKKEEDKGKRARLTCSIPSSAEFCRKWLPSRKSKVGEYGGRTFTTSTTSRRGRTILSFPAPVPTPYSYKFGTWSRACARLVFVQNRTHSKCCSTIWRGWNPFPRERAGHQKSPRGHWPKLTLSLKWLKHLNYWECFVTRMGIQPLPLNSESQRPRGTSMRTRSSTATEPCHWYVVFERLRRGPIAACSGDVAGGYSQKMICKNLRWWRNPLPEDVCARDGGENRKLGWSTCSA